MNQSTISQITEAVHPLTQKLGQGSEIYWRAQYKQVYIDAWTVIVFWGAVAVLTIIATFFLARHITEMRKKASDYDKSLFTGLKYATVGAGTLFSMLWFGIVVTGGVQPLINPVQQTILNIEGQLIPAPK